MGANSVETDMMKLMNDKLGIDGERLVGGKPVIEPSTIQSSYNKPLEADDYEKELGFFQSFNKPKIAHRKRNQQLVENEERYQGEPPTEVKCVDVDDYALTLNELYDVEDTKTMNNETHYLIWNDYGDEEWYPSSIFEPIKPKSFGGDTGIDADYVPESKRKFKEGNITNIKSHLWHVNQEVMRLSKLSNYSYNDQEVIDIIEKHLLQIRNEIGRINM